MSQEIWTWPEWYRNGLAGQEWYRSHGDREYAIRRIARHKKNWSDPTEVAIKQLDEFLETHPEAKNFDFEEHYRNRPAGSGLSAYYDMDSDKV